MRIIIFVAILAVIVLLQVYLSKKENKWFGLILPIICFLFALIIVPLNMIAPTSGVDMDYIVKHIIVFGIFNIPTIIFMIIYLVCRKGKNK